jgi:hypothetical protein
MGARGFQPRIDPVKEVQLIQEEIVPPPGLSAKAKKLFARLVDQNRRSNVSILQVDSEQYADLANAMIRRDAVTDNREWLAIQREIDELRAQLNMGPRNRARAGVRDVKKQAAKSAAATVLELAKQRA